MLKAISLIKGSNDSGSQSDIISSKRLQYLNTQQDAHL